MILNNLIGLKVNKFRRIEDYYQIYFSEDFSLLVFNRCFFDSGDFYDMEGDFVNGVAECNDSVVIEFCTGRKFFIYMKESDYHGPEAMILRLNGQVCAVWN